MSVKQMIGFTFTKPINNDLDKRLNSFINRFDEGIWMLKVDKDTVILNFFDGDPDVNSVRKRVLRIARNAGNDLCEESMPV